MRYGYTWPLLLVLAGTGCLRDGERLLCDGDEDCDDGRRCERVSGLCVPELGPPSFEAGGISGAFECLLPSDERAGARVPGLASVVLRAPDRDEACEGPPAQALAGLEVGCRVTREALPRVRGDGEEIEFWVLRFDRLEGDPDNPTARLAVYLRVDAAQAGTFEAPEAVTALYFERCAQGVDTELRLRSVSTQGSLQIAEIGEDRIEGRFDLDLASLDVGGEFGAGCTLPRPCPAGACALVEQTTSRCATGACVPDPRAANPETGFCSGRCEDHRDCGFDRQTAPDAYCLVPPGRPEGACIRLCDPAASSCPGGSSCRPGSDFDDFPGSGGPARCLDDCIVTDSTPAAPGCGGGGRDAGLAPDAGPPDAGEVPDAGGSPLGAACGPGAPCPSGWFCAQASPGPLRANGFCSRACAGDPVCRMGYTGPGAPACRPALRDIDTEMVVNPACLIQCGADFGQDGQCPGATTCGDIVDNTTRMPGSDGRPDFCTE